MTTPPKLRPGDRVRIVAPSRSLGGLIAENSFSEAGVEEARGILEELGLDAELAANVHPCDDALSTPVESRIEDLESAYRDPEVRGIIGLAGGSNAIQLLRTLDFDVITSHPKILSSWASDRVGSRHRSGGVRGVVGRRVLDSTPGGGAWRTTSDRRCRRQRAGTGETREAGHFSLSPNKTESGS